MSSQENRLTVCTTKKIRLAQHRAAVRLPSDRETFNPPTGGRRADLWWEAMAVRLQQAKVALIVSRRFECGTLLQVELAPPSGPAATPLLARVQEIKPQETGGYLVHATFIPPLADEVYQALQ